MSGVLSGGALWIIKMYVDVWGTYQLTVNGFFLLRVFRYKSYYNFFVSLQ